MHIDYFLDKFSFLHASPLHFKNFTPELCKFDSKYESDNK